MYPTFLEILRSSPDEQRALFSGAAAELETRAENIEKDLYVCWVLDFLFNRRPSDAVRLYFKGGTSLSKAYGLIRRFSEDIDIGIYKADLHVPLEAEIAALKSVTQQQKVLAERVDEVARQYISGPLREMLAIEIAEAEAAIDRVGHFSLSSGYDAYRRKEALDILVVGYKSVFDASGGYVEAAVRIEGGARPDPVPAEPREILPYVASEFGSDKASDLSKRTEQQAAALEQTAAALDEITANVKNASLRAEEARQASRSAEQSATHSGQIVSEAVGAMARIEQSSKQISSIIGVIDEIAFQTNLLALNAGVEAARAGEAGKGFAVVAQEVRELAQRSAQAAKEIKDLIRNSSDEVSSGVKLVSETGEALKQIQTSIVEVNDHMQAIASSAREQSTGLSEVNSAINQVDQTTQQNAAMVEETTAASVTLAQEAGNLRHTVGRFQLAHTSSKPAAPQLRRPAPIQNSSKIAHKSPVRQITAKLANAFQGNAAASSDSWEEF